MRQNKLEVLSSEQVSLITRTTAQQEAPTDAIEKVGYSWEIVIYIANTEC